MQVVNSRSSAVHQVLRTRKIQIAPENVVILLLTVFEESEADPKVNQCENKLTLVIVFSTDVFGFNIPVTES